VKNLGGFSDLAGLMDVYTLGQPQDAKPFAEDCRKFVSSSGMDPAMLKIGKILCKVIQESAARDSSILIYHDPEVESDMKE